MTETETDSARWRANIVFRNAESWLSDWTGRWRTREKAMAQAERWRAHEHCVSLVEVWIESDDGRRHDLATES